MTGDGGATTLSSVQTWPGEGGEEQPSFFSPPFFVLFPDFGLNFPAWFPLAARPGLNPFGTLDLKICGNKRNRNRRIVPPPLPRPGLDREGGCCSPVTTQNSLPLLFLISESEVEIRNREFECGLGAL